MVDVLTKEQRSYCMSRIRGKNTGPEVTLRKLLRCARIEGFRAYSRLVGKPDIVFPKSRLVIFIDGCFWHKCPKCFIKPATRIAFWMKKILGNVMRDKVVNSTLAKSKWTVVRVWEHEIRRDPVKVVNKIIKKLKH